MPEIFKLYSYYRSSCSYRIRIALAHKGIAYTYVPVHLVKDGGEQYSEAYLAHNPMGEVPSLEILDGHGQTVGVIAQSMAILEYLEERFPTPRLLPSDVLERAKVRQIAESINTSIQPIQNLRVMKRIMAQFEVERDVAVSWNYYWIERGFKGIERLLQQTAGVYSFGDAVTYADLFLIPQYYNAVRFKIDMTQFPTIERVCLAAQKLEAFQKAHPDNQPDAV